MEHPFGSNVHPRRGVQGIQGRWLFRGFVGDEILPSDVGIIIIHEIRIPITQPGFNGILERRAGFRGSNWAYLGRNRPLPGCNRLRDSNERLRDSNQTNLHLPRGCMRFRGFARIRKVSLTESPNFQGCFFSLKRLLPAPQHQAELG